VLLSAPIQALEAKAPGAGIAARPASLPYTARKDTLASGPLAPLELPGEEMPGCLGALTLDYYHCNKELGQHPRYSLLFPLFTSLCARLAKEPARLCYRSGSREILFGACLCANTGAEGRRAGVGSASRAMERPAPPVCVRSAVPASTYRLRPKESKRNRRFLIGAGRSGRLCR